jgi:hypothetical protein
MVYAGHQFGSYNPQLGDGRGLLLGEITGTDGTLWDIHLKGAGKTPYSRFGDGRAVLRSTIREYLGSEALAGLGIASTRALCIVGSHTPVQRESMETAAGLLRLAQSHIRFGHFEYFHYQQRPDLVATLADYVIDRHFPQWSATTDRHEQFFNEVVKRTAQMIADWQAAGFAHGVMNTDNMSILGDTFDYGPFGFLDDFNPGFICNHSDHQGRYAFNQQPSIGLWNLNALAHALSSLLSTEQLREALMRYEPQLQQRFNDNMQRKLGLKKTRPEDAQLVSDLLTLLAREGSDYTQFFRQLCDFSEHEECRQLSDHRVDRAGFERWAQNYRHRLSFESQTETTRQQQMKANNPKYILRNYLAQKAIEQAEDHGDFSEIERLLTLLQNPFDEHPEWEDYAKAPPEWGKKLAISCSS